MLSAFEIQLHLLAWRFGPLSTMLSHASLHRCRSTRTSFSGCALSIVDTLMVAVLRSQLSLSHSMIDAIAASSGLSELAPCPLELRGCTRVFESRHFLRP
jgi:hypothetical protein